jgi:hypothetical protein
MQFQTRSSGEGFRAVLVVAHESVNVLMTAFVVLEMLFKLEGLSTIFILTLEDSVW